MSAQRRDRRGHMLLRGGVQAFPRFVEQDQRGVADQYPGQRHPA